MTQLQVAEILGVSKYTIGKYESNVAAPPLDKLIHLATIYNCSIDYLLNLTDRTNFYLDEFPEGQQKLILQIIDGFRMLNKEEK